MLMPLATGVRLGVLVTSLTLGCCGCARGGFSVNHMDIAPKYAGVVMGVSNTAGTLAGALHPAGRRPTCHLKYTCFLTDALLSRQF